MIQKKNKVIDDDEIEGATTFIGNHDHKRKRVLLTKTENVFNNNGSYHSVQSHSTKKLKYDCKTPSQYYSSVHSREKEGFILSSGTGKEDKIKCIKSEITQLKSNKAIKSNILIDLSSSLNISKVNQMAQLRHNKIIKDSIKVLEFFIL